MLDLSEPFEFEWDQGNIRKNLIKHKIECKEAEEVFFDENLVLSDDYGHSDKEIRYKIIGKNGRNLILFISFTVRNNKIRIISARKADKKEKQIYDQK